MAAPTSHDRGLAGPRARVPLRLAVTCAGDPADRGTYSGSPAALLAALDGIVSEALPVRGDLGPRGQTWFERALMASRLRPRHVPALRENRSRLRRQVALSRLMPLARGLAARHRLRAGSGIDAVVQYGTEFDLAPDTEFVTIEDATFLQSVEGYEWPWLLEVSESRVARFKEEARRRYRRARACTFMSHWAADSCVDDHGIDAGKVHVVGVGRNHEPPCPVRDWSSPRVLFVGYDWERKNGEAVVRAFTRLREEHPAARLDVVGLHPRIEVAGVTGHGAIPLDDPAGQALIERLFADATFFAMPSVHEPAGIVYAEAQAAGLASIGTTSGGAATVIGDTGLLVPPTSDELLLDAMRTLAHPERAAELGARARNRAPLFTWRAVAERLLRALRPPGVDLESLADFVARP